MRWAMCAAVIAALAATGCGPDDHSSALRTTGTNAAPPGSSGPSTPVATATPTPPKATTAAKPKPVAPKPSPTPTPTPPKPTTVAKPKPKPAASTCGAPANPWGYNFCGRGSLIYSPNGNVCAYFHCIDNFANGSGYMVECNDGMFSMSGGRRGACSYHSGEGQPVYGGP